MMRVALSLLVASVAAAASEPVFPPGAVSNLPFSPGVKTDGFVYVSGQGAQDSGGRIPASFDEQVRQCLNNVQAVVKSAGLTMEHVVYAQVYLLDMKNYEAMNRIYSEFFPKSPPARTTIGVTSMPLKTPVEISAVAVRDLKNKKVIEHPTRKMPVPVSPAIHAGDRVYLTGGLGRDFNTGAVPRQPRQQVKLAMDTADAVLRAAGMELRHLVSATVYVSPQMSMKLLAEAIDEYFADETATTIVQTASLPFGVQLEVTGIASREIKRLGKCAAIGNTVYCSGRAGTTRQVMDAIKSELEANGSGMDKVVAVNVYLDDIEQFAAMNKVYAPYLGKVKPTRTTVQPWKTVPDLALPATTGAQTPDDSPRVQIAVVATR